MKRVNLLFTIISATVLLLAVPVAEHVCAKEWEFDCESASILTWQGKVTDSSGNPLEPGDYSLVYCYYEDSVGRALIGCCTTSTDVGTFGAASAVFAYPQPIWEDTIKAGFFLRPDLPTDVWLEIIFNGEVISPRTRVTDVPKAGVSERMRGDFFSSPGRALIVDAALDSSGAINMKTNDSGSSLTLYRTNADPSPEPGIVMRTNETGSMASLFNAAGDVKLSLTSEGAGTFDDTVWSKTGYKFPDGTVQTTAATGGGGCWDCPANYVYLHDNNDSVGMGTTTPSEKLEVVGNLRVTGKAMIGFSHTSTGAFTFVAGSGNTVSGAISTVSGGQNNTASGERSFVGGGSSNCASGDWSFVAGGEADTASGFKSTIGGGQVNTASEFASTVSGGSDNTANGYAGTVSGGTQNVASGMYSTLGGGWNNTASGYGSTVGGGHNNTASNDLSTVGGGYVNIASGGYSSVGGGYGNTASGSFTTISGGYQNSSAGTYSVIPGGFYDTLTSNANYSMAFGRLVYVNTSYRVVFFGTNSGRLGINRDDHDGGINFPIHVGTSASNGNGAYLTNGGTWTNGSSREFKENFQELDGQEVLNRINNLPMESWEYKGSGERHIWPCAEDFHEQFDVGVIKEDGTRDTEYLAAGDVAGVALVGVQELYRITQELHKKTQEIEELRAQLGEQEQLKVRVAQLEALIETLLAQSSSDKGGSDKLALDR